MGTQAEDDAADELAFAQGAGDEPAKTEEKTPEPTATPAEEVKPEVKYAQITEDDLAALRAKVATIDDLKATLEKSNGTAFGKIGGIERVLKELQAGGQSIGELSPDDFAELKESFPELADMTAKGLNRALAKLKGNPAPAIDQTKVDELVQQGVAKTLEQRQAQEQVEADKALTAEHADWREVKEKPEFKTWLQTQPQRVQKTYAKTWDADFLADVFTAFKAVKPAAPKPADNTRKDRLAAAVNPRGTGGHAPAPSDDDDFNAGFNAARRS